MKLNEKANGIDKINIKRMSVVFNTGIYLPDTEDERLTEERASEIIYIF